LRERCPVSGDGQQKAGKSKLEEIFMGRFKLAGGIALALVAAVPFVTATSASAQGTTAFTCTEVAFNTGSFSDPHCTSTVGEHNFAHISIPAGTQTEVLRTNEGTCEEQKAPVRST
jgi:hypothetical protein